MQAVRNFAYALCFLAAACTTPTGLAAPERQVPTVVRMDCPDDSGWGSGVRVSPVEVLTANHVAECFPLSERYGERDVAWVALPVARWADVAPTFRAPVLGEKVECWGYPGSPGGDGTRGLTVTDGNVANTADETNSGEVQVTCPIRPGMSGGPVIGEDGAVVGLIVSYWPTIDGWGNAEPGPFARAHAAADSHEPTPSPSASGTR